MNETPVITVVYDIHKVWKFLLARFKQVIVNENCVDMTLPPS